MKNPPMKRSFCILVLLSLPFSLFSEGPGKEVKRSYHRDGIEEAYLDSIEEEFEMLKGVPESYRPSVLVALSAYPELRKFSIELKEADLRTTMVAQPVPGSLMTPRNDRRFRIMIDTLSPDSEGKLFEELPFEARIGVMAHELAHILDYSRMDLGGIFRYGVRYLFPSSRKELEARTDRIAVDRGFGWQLLAFKEHLRRKAELKPSYRDYKDRIYLSTKDLMTIMREHPEYAPRSAQR